MESLVFKFQPSDIHCKWQEPEEEIDKLICLGSSVFDSRVLDGTGGW